MNTASAKTTPKDAMRTGERLAEQWRRVRLGDVADISAGLTLGRALGDKVTRRVPYLRVANVKDGHLDLSHVKDIEASENEITALRLQNGDLLLTEGGDPDKLGRGYFWRSELPECVHQNHIFRVRVNRDDFDPAFLSHQFSSPYGKAYFFRHAKQTTGIASINRRILDAFPLLAPSIAVQRDIAMRLNEQFEATATLRAALEAQLAAARALPAAYLRVIFGGSEAQCWPRIPLCELCVDGGQYGTSEKSTSEPGGLPVLRMGNLVNGQIDWSKLKYLKQSSSDAEKYSLEKGDLLFNRTNSVELVGKSAVFRREQDAVFASYLIRFRMLPDRADPHFVCAFINSQFGRAFIEVNMVRAIGQANVSASTMQKMAVPTPPLATQRTLAAQLEEQFAATATLRVALEARLAETERFPAALLCEAFCRKAVSR